MEEKIKEFLEEALKVRVVFRDWTGTYITADQLIFIPAEGDIIRFPYHTGKYKVIRREFDLDYDRYDDPIVVVVKKIEEIE